MHAHIYTHIVVHMSARMSIHMCIHMSVHMFCAAAIELATAMLEEARELTCGQKCC